MNANMEIEIFRVGDYGPKGAYAREDLQRIAEDYDPAWHEAPVTLDHRQDGPAYGWVEGLRCVGDVLVARMKDLHESLREWIHTGAYKKRSVELYRSFARTKRPYLRAVSFLGACPPEVKGLADPVFQEDEGERIVVEFECRDDAEGEPATAFVEPEGREAAAVAQAESGPSSRAIPPNESDESPRMAEVESPENETARLAAELEHERNGRRREALDRFCEEARQGGRILPAWETGGLVDFMLALDATERRIETADGRQLTALEWFQEFVRSLAPQIDLGEMAPARSWHGHPVHAPQAGSLGHNPALPRPTDRAAIRPDTLALHERAVAYCEQHASVTYVEALQAVARM